ncbi:glycerophosphodiester phosphodiesterase [uncultured Friedmanniella sp.]|uniref:glycerophosphodiester phosphodiesterase n=1 Tax=uncultured Friedmanniella sp. TaxID=335381 RepID=UPI0035C9440F
MTAPPSTGPASRLSRRTLLGGLAAGVVSVSGCGRTRTPAAAPATVTGLLSGHPFYAAHRGGGGDWPEMTAYAYGQASQLPGLAALEVSVCLSADGVLVCSHDPTTTRVTGVPYTIAEETWQTLSGLQVSAKDTTDPGQPARPLTRFDEVVDAYADRFVLFVEAKVPAAEAPLMARMAGLGHPERVIWKQYVNGPRFAEAKEHGFTTWGYVLNEPAHLGDNLARFAASSSLDLLGAAATESDAFVSDVVSAASEHQKPAIMWPIRSAADRDRAVGLGCQGLMTSTISELLPRAASTTGRIAIR